MSKKKGNKKNFDLEEDFEGKKNDNVEVTSKTKSKTKKKGKNAGDWSDNEDADVSKNAHVSDDEDVPKPAAKKSQKKGTGYGISSVFL